MLSKGVLFEQMLSEMLSEMLFEEMLLEEMLSEMFTPEEMPVVVGTGTRPLTRAVAVAATGDIFEDMSKGVLFEDFGFLVVSTYWSNPL